MISLKFCSTTHSHYGKGPQSYSQIPVQIPIYCAPRIYFTPSGVDFPFNTNIICPNIKTATAQHENAFYILLQQRHPHKLSGSMWSTRNSLRVLLLCRYIFNKLASVNAHKAYRNFALMLVVEDQFFFPKAYVWHFRKALEYSNMVLRNLFKWNSLSCGWSFYLFNC